MRKAIFEVPAEHIGDFTDRLVETGLENSITGRTEDDEIEIEVLYDKGQEDSVDELDEFLSELNG